MVQTSTSFRRDAQEPDGPISLSEVISALSYALDLTEGAAHGHALRSCLLGMRIGIEAKLSVAELGSLYFALLLKDAGCGSDTGVMCQITGSDDLSFLAGMKLESERKPHLANLPGLKYLWKHMRPEAGTLTRAEGILRLGLDQYANRERISQRCERGSRIVRKLGMGEAAALAVRHLDEHWDGKGFPDSMKGDRIPLLSRVCAVAQHLDIFAIDRGTEQAMTALKERSGTWFDPELVRVAISLDGAGRLWAQCSPEDTEEETRRAVLAFDNSGRQHLEPGRIDQICEAFADVVDAKSHFTFRHSLGVADAALGIAERMGLKANRVQLIRRAALLHDIGKLSLPNSILDKTGELNAQEWEAVYRHPSMTRAILERIEPFQEMAVVAGEHHEKLDGSGYPHRLEARHLSIESRIIAVADVYGALSEDRPYRPGLTFDQIVSIMSKLVPHQLDSDCFDALTTVLSGKREMSFEFAPHLVASPLVYAAEA